MRVHDHDAAHSLRAQVREETLRVREALRVERERPVALHVVDVEPDRIGRDLALAEVLGHEAHARLRVVAVATLVVAERPHRGQRRAAGERRVALDHLLRRRPVDEVVVDLAAVRTEGQEAVRLVAHVEGRAVSVVEEDPVRTAAPQDDVERHRGVDRVGRGVVAEGVAVPHRVAVAAELPAALVELADLLAEAVDVLVGPQALPDLEALAVDRRGQLRVVLVQRLTGSARHRDTEGRVREREAQSGRRDDRLVALRPDGEGRLAELARDDRIGVVAAEGRSRREPHADHLRREDAHRGDPLLAAEHEHVALAGRRRERERGPARPCVVSQQHDGERGDARLPGTDHRLLPSRPPSARPQAGNRTPHSAGLTPDPLRFDTRRDSFLSKRKG